MIVREETYGFGVNPKLSVNHFFLVIPANKELNVQVYERFQWTDGEVQKPEKADRLLIEISFYKCSKVSADLTAEFNARLKKDKLKVGRFVVGGTPVEKLFGKELMVLLWGIEDCDPSVIPTAIRNWKGLMPEERRWLYTMTNASTGQLKDKKGWRIALRKALCENPIEENPQISLLEMFTEE